MISCIIFMFISTNKFIKIINNYMEFSRLWILLYIIVYMINIIIMHTLYKYPRINIRYHVISLPIQKEIIAYIIEIFTYGKTSIYCEFIILICYLVVIFFIYIILEISIKYYLNMDLNIIIINILLIKELSFLIIFTIFNYISLRN